MPLDFAGIPIQCQRAGAIEVGEFAVVGCAGTAYRGVPWSRVTGTPINGVQNLSPMATNGLAFVSNEELNREQLLTDEVREVDVLDEKQYVKI